MRKSAGVWALACTVGAVLALPALASARTQVVYAGGPSSFSNTLGSKYGAEANDYFPHSLTIHVGDTVSLTGMQSNFHTVDLPPNGKGALTLIVPSGKPAPATNDFAGSPFWWSVASPAPPELTFNSTLLGPSGGKTYNGKSRIDTGLPLGPPKSLNVKFLKAGSYHYFCDVHYNMQGIIIVKPSSAKVPSAAAVKKSVAAQVKTDTSTAKALAAVKPSTTSVSVGRAGKHNVEILAMFPSQLTVKVGSTVTFSMPKGTGETHTATFGPAGDFNVTNQGPGFTPTGYVGQVAATFNSSGPFDPRAALPSSPPGTAIDVSTTAHGNGFASSGPMTLEKNAPTPGSAKFAFTQAGTYHYACMIHPFMQATVTVTP